MKSRFEIALLLLPFAVTSVRADCTGVSPSNNTTLKSVTVATGLPGRPLFVASPPGDVNRLFIVEQDGFIRIKKRGDQPNQWSTYLDISTKVQAAPILDEMGLLGLAFDPNYASNGFFYVNYIEGPVGSPWFTVVARYSVSGNPDVADPNSEFRLLRFSQPQDNHNGGQLQFGPDGFLYISTGDGGGSGDPHGGCGNGQNRSALFGKMLRVDVRGLDPNSLAPDCGGVSAGYRIPSTNPLVDGPGGDCDEVWAYGLRNPWRSTFDAATGDLYLADVGQNCWEEINYVASGGGAGRNYAWRSMEGNHCFDPGNQANCNPAAVSCPGVPSCGDPGFTLPVLEYGHTNGACSITGGYVYRGCLMPNFLGTYFYGDYCSAFVRSFRISGGVVTNPQDFTSQIDPAGTLHARLTSFGLDAQGEIYITNRSGSVLRILPPFPALEVSGPGAAVPFQLSPASWSWENLEFSTMHPVSSYHVYRGTPGGSFMCVRNSLTPQWAGGDPLSPAAGALFAYLVTAISPTGEQTLTGSPSATLLPNPCP